MTDHMSASDAHTLHAEEALYPTAIARPEVWPLIAHIDDIQPQIRPGSGIHVFDDDPFLVLRYVTTLPGTFQTALDLESRGLIFEKSSGRLLSRTFQKFFNLNERQSLEDLDFSRGAWAEIKLDGSMIGGFRYRGETFMHTRGGLSDIANTARALASAGHEALITEAAEMGITPCFEFTSPDNRVVIPYQMPQVTLLSLREHVSGCYREDLLADLANAHGVPRAERIAAGLTSAEDVRALISDVHGRADIEGVVLCFPDGHRIKIKAAEYMRRHKILANLDNEKYVYQCYLDDVVDDTSAALGGDRGRALADFIGDLSIRVETLCSDLVREVADLAAIDQKERSRIITTRYTGAMQALAFAAASGHDPRERLLQILSRKVHHLERRTELKRELDLPDWTVKLEALR